MFKKKGIHPAGPSSIHLWNICSFFADLQNSTNFKDILLLLTNGRKCKFSSFKSKGSKVSLRVELDHGPSWPFEKKKLKTEFIFFHLNWGYGFQSFSSLFGHLKNLKTHFAT